MPQKGVLIWFLILLSIEAAGQASITGKVIDSKTSEPLPFANVFLNNTTIGAVTGLEGEFKLSNISAPAVYDVVVSFVGYQSYRTKVSLEAKELKLGEIKLVQSEIELGNVEVKGTRDVAWERKLKNFERVFLGSDKAARQCQIKNSWVIDFVSADKNSLIAKASAPIEIENRALGYKLNFSLNSFVANNTNFLIQGDARFEELKESSLKEKETWRVNREESYRHSLQHMFKSILDGRTFGEGFRIFKKGTTEFIDTTNLVTATTKKGVYRISIKEPVDIWYGSQSFGALNPTNFEITSMKLKNGYVLVNPFGYEMNPTDISLSGVMGESRIAHMLPLNYLSNKDLVIDRERKSDLDINALREQVYLHTDRPYYYPGETIWYKGYVHYATHMLRDSLSKVVYVEWIDSLTQSVVQTQKLAVKEGVFLGNLSIKKTTPGMHYLRAYTQLGRNFGDGNLSIKPVPVLDLLFKVDPGLAEENPEQSTNASMETEKEVYGHREKIMVSLTLRDSEGKPIGGNLSASVTHEKQVVPVDIAGSILKNYPLRDLKESADERTKKYPIELGLNFKGRFLNEANRPESALLSVIQLSPNKFSITQSDEAGLFELSGMNFQDTALFSIKATGNDKKLYGKVEMIDTDRPPVDIRISTKPIRYQVMETPQRHYGSYEVPADSRMLKEITIRGEKIDPDPPEFKPYGKGQYRLEKKDINTRYGNLLMAIQGRFPGLIVRQTYVENEELRWVVYSIRTQTSSILHVKEVSVLINGMLYRGEPAKILLNLDPTTIESIEYRDGINVRLGAEGGFGTLYITTRTGMSNEPGVPPDPVDLVKLVGFSKTQAFPSPDYSTPAVDSTEPDFRSLLYWNPMIIPEEETGSASFTFYSGDLGGRYRIEVQGVNSEGEPVRVVRSIVVNEK